MKTLQETIFQCQGHSECLIGSFLIFYLQLFKVPRMIIIKYSSIPIVGDKKLVKEKGMEINMNCDKGKRALKHPLLPFDTHLPNPFHTLSSPGSFPPKSFQIHQLRLGCTQTTCCYSMQTSHYRGCQKIFFRVANKY